MLLWAHLRYYTTTLTTSCIHSVVFCMHHHEKMLSKLDYRFIIFKLIFSVSRFMFRSFFSGWYFVIFRIRQLPLILLNRFGNQCVCGQKCINSHTPVWLFFFFVYFFFFPSFHLLLSLLLFSSSFTLLLFLQKKWQKQFAIF